ncbi:polar amino acid transport system permease protein [Rhodobium orientis]|uniref:Ectoine/hydroxyectoine ABC transporter permease subunit EhuD n=1 Tax=Rhodobium orientis TaxID=34017 RepID=A0A327JGF3_9HYPH|nr:ectoine/hydroxyectoine ABC transporter permease subunit EhuD [Rhodobium orientis]MBB4305436.1 polar amino acid transport system permease protein [Rhodobium orientis]MBK5948345.1 ectoine/hydroxyectoine ABC transporter permease subunit EhuD [Rhodobium orientis]RAI25487.1 ectoine/hydroxyectoine ABC transporter permease subunit EhuD [Rhodobium orientis]
MGFDWRWDFTFEILPRLLLATLNTLLAAGLGYAIAVVLGLVLALAQRTPSRVLTRAVREVVEFIRSTPLVLQIFFVYYVGPQFGIRLSPWTSGMIAIGLHYASYLSEVYRGGLESVPKGQWEAARALNFSTARTYFRIIIPQALPPSLAGMGNYLVGIFKDTPMLSVIGVAELMHTANAIGSESYRFLEPYTLVGVIFLLISLPTAALIRVFESWVRKKLGLI